MPGQPDRILAVKLADLGDLLLTEPALRSLRRAYPAAAIDVLTTPAAGPLVELLGHDLNWITFNKGEFDRSAAALDPRAVLRLAQFGTQLRRARYDAVVLFHHLTTPKGALKFKALATASGAPTIAGLDNGRGTFLTDRALDLGFGVRHEVDYMLDVARSIGGHNVDPRPGIDATEYLSTVELPQQYAAIFPTTGPYAPARNWHPESFARVARELAQDSITPVILGAADAQEAAKQIQVQAPSAIDLTGKTTIPDLIPIVRDAAVTITGDSFPGHLANALGSKLVSIFGPSNHRAWKPYGAIEMATDTEAPAVVVRYDVPCSPCLYTGYRLGRRHGCPVRTCLNNVTPEDVMAAVRTVIGYRT